MPSSNSSWSITRRNRRHRDKAEHPQALKRVQFRLYPAHGFSLTQLFLFASAGIVPGRPRHALLVSLIHKPRTIPRGARLDKIISRRSRQERERRTVGRAGLREGYAHADRQQLSAIRGSLEQRGFAFTYADETPVGLSYAKVTEAS